MTGDGRGEDEESGSNAEKQIKIPIINALGFRVQREKDFYWIDGKLVTVNLQNKS